jgi:uroporphyrin-3 C-methyltransferase
MSKKKKTAKKDEQAEVASEDATFESVEDESAAPEIADEQGHGEEPGSPGPSEQNVTGEAVSRKSGSGFVAWLALLAAVVALAAIGLDFLRDRAAADDSLENDAAISSVTSTVRALQDSVDSLQQDVTALSDQLARRDSEIANIGRRLDDRLQQIESLHGRLSTIEDNVASLQGISTGARDAWLLAEAEYYMQIANAQLQLAGNPQLAAHALGLADERILQLANPALTNVRRTLSNELRALELMDRPDTAGVTLTLASLADQVDSLPLRMEIEVDDDDDTAVGPELTGTDRALASLRSMVDSVVSVRRTDEALKPLIAPEAQYFLRANLALQLQAARLAVLRGEENIFRQSLDDAAAWLNEFYDTDSSAVQSVLQAIADIRDSVFSQALPDISESLRLLRQFNALADAQAAPAVQPQEEQPAEPEQ